ncbi:MAG: ABC transporter ATP-binding protein/permease [Anaerolineae bacterium]|nr:ABC transporter ATP-binding protein/permease [Anaerolineae bacterium]
MRAVRSRTYQITLDQIKKHRLTIILSVLLVIVATALDVVTPLFFRFLIDHAVPSRDFRLIAGVVAGMILLPVVSAALSYLEGHQRDKIGTSVTQALRQQAFEHLLSIQMSHLERLNSGELLQLVTRTCGEIGDVFVGDSLLPTISRSFFLIGNVLAMFAINGRLAAATMLAVPTLYVFSRIIRRRMLQLDEQFYATVEAGSSLAHETLAGLRTIRAANGQQRAAGLWRGWVERYRQSKLAISALHGFYVDTLSSFLNNLILAIVLGLGVFEILGDRLTIGTLIAFLVYAPRVLSSLQQLTRTQLGVSTMRVAAAKLNAHFALPLERSDGAALPASPTSPVGVKVAFEDISFRYGRGEAGVSHLSFTIHPGEFIGIVGPSGGGKSTIFDLLTGFYNPDEGRILIDDVDMQRLSLLAIREAMGVVFQDTFLWNMSLLENLTYPRDAATVSDVGWAVRATALEPFISGLPEGLQTVVGERGNTLSGGERQRIAVARAMLRNPRLLLLDEATSALDPLTEEKLRHALESLRQGRTTIVIAHRLATITQADRIIVIDKGQVVEQGTPADLLEQRGLYYAFYQAQKLD